MAKATPKRKRMSTSELKKYIERKLLLSKLDSALLFFSSSLSITFGVGYSLLGGKWLQYYLPMLFLGWFMPIYIGYVRGSLAKDSVEERIRGWIYLMIGFGFYSSTFLFNIIAVDLLKLDLHFLLPGAVPFFIIGFLWGFYGETVVRIICNAFRIQMKDLKGEVKQAFVLTGHSATLLALLLPMISVIATVDVEPANPLAAIMLILLITGVLALIIRYEWKARKLLHE